MPASGSPPIETISISRLFYSPTNPRRNDAAVPHVAASLRRFGWQQPIVARRTGEVIAGNTRLKAAQELGMTEVPVWWFDGSDLDAVAFSIADNRTHEFAERSPADPRGTPPENDAAPRLFTAGRDARSSERGWLLEQDAIRDFGGHPVRPDTRAPGRDPPRAPRRMLS
jgi:hypothetical protein